ncbi:MAG TPA: hypothetical protein ENK13_02740, partial [Thermopetrobacter sp.]|nr:hypothetical protein [Thermopetrobacter sp.]
MAAGADGRPSRKDLDALADRLAEHERRRAGEERRRRRRAASPYGFGFRLVTELVAGVAAGFLWIRTGIHDFIGVFIRRRFTAG